MREMNGILTLTRNNLALTQRAIHSFLRQNIPTKVGVIDNYSTDGTREWLRAYGWLIWAEVENTGVSAGWNRGLEWFFSHGADNVLVCGNDTWLPESFYRTLLSCNLPFVTGVAVDNMEQANQKPEIYPLEPRPDFSAFCIRRETWEKLGPFDERFKHYSSDQDYHLRAHRLGIHLYKAAIPFYHERSSTLRNAPPEEAREIQEQANRDREELKKKWGCTAGGPDYEALFSPATFGVDCSEHPNAPACDGDGITTSGSPKYCGTG
jgi:GT2 family glycosyltransferase